MAVDVLNALSWIGKREPTELSVASILTIIFALRDWCDCDPARTTKTRDGGDRRVSCRVDDGNRTVHVSGKDARAVGCYGGKNWVEAKRYRIDYLVCGRVDDKDFIE